MLCIEEKSPCENNMIGVGMEMRHVGQFAKQSPRSSPNTVENAFQCSTVIEWLGNDW